MKNCKQTAEKCKLPFVSDVFQMEHPVHNQNQSVPCTLGWLDLSKLVPGAIESNRVWLLTWVEVGFGWGSVKKINFHKSHEFDVNVSQTKQSFENDVLYFGNIKGWKR